MWSRLSLIASMLLGVANTSFAQKEHPLIPAIKYAEKSATAAAGITDYSATFSKKEIVGRKMLAHTAFVKVRHKPFGVYMRFLNPSAGREVIYVPGQNNGNIVAHDVGIKAIVGTIQLAPTSKRALSESKYPITRFGLKTMCDLCITQWKKESRFGECDVKFFPNAKMSGQAVEVIEVRHPRRRKQFPFHITRLYIDKKSKLPVRVENYDWPRAQGGKPVLVEQYTYTNVQTNRGFRAADFDPRNRNYRFR